MRLTTPASRAGLPLAKQYEQLQTTLDAYRFVMGHSRQEDLIWYLGADVARLRIDLSPPA